MYISSASPAALFVQRPVLAKGIYFFGCVLLVPYMPLALFCCQISCVPVVSLAPETSPRYVQGPS